MSDDVTITLCQPPHRLVARYNVQSCFQYCQVPPHLCCGVALQQSNPLFSSCQCEPLVLVDRVRVGGRSKGELESRAKRVLCVTFTLNLELTSPVTFKQTQFVMLLLDKERGLHSEQHRVFICDK